jgi:hypothetical protein
MTRKRFKPKGEKKPKKVKQDRSNYAKLDHEYDPLTGELKEEEMDLSGTICPHRCEYHDEPCVVVMEYKDKRVQKMVETLSSITGTDAHTKESIHYCELCQLANRQNGNPATYYRNPENGVIYQDKPRKLSYKLWLKKQGKTV